LRHEFHGTKSLAKLKTEQFMCAVQQVPKLSRVKFAKYGPEVLSAVALFATLDSVTFARIQINGRFRGRPPTNALPKVQRSSGWKAALAGVT
jgi:hypothetical protein